MDSTQICIFKEGDQVGLCGFLESTDGCRLETQVGLDILGNLANQALEGELSDEQLG